MGGVNFYESLAEHAITDSVYSYNMDPAEYGYRTRLGYQEWATGLSGEVRTLIPLKGEIASQDALFACTSAGIYEVTSSAASPSIAQSFASSADGAGFCSWRSYTNDGGDKFLLVCDDENGLHEYEPATSTWSIPTGITNVNESDLVFVTEHKERIWFVERDTSDAWYLPVGQKSGAATKFALGNKFPHGGALLAIYNWSVDGGDGLDDLLVFISTSGDVAIYEGTDVASSNTWQSRGTWFIGTPPSSRNIGRNIGGQLHLLSAFGLISVNDLVQGVTVQQATGQNSIARRITRLIRSDMATKLSDEEWDVVPLPSQGSFLILRPFSSDETPIQYVFGFTRAAWGFWRDPPMNCCVEWNGTTYFGDKDGTVHIMQGALDAVSRDGTGGTDVSFSFLTAFSDMGAPVRLKKVHYIQPRFIADGGVAPAFNSCAVYDYSLVEPLLTVGSVTGAGSAWDVALWDLNIWGGTSTASERVLGGSGEGTMVALAVQGRSQDRTTLLELNVIYEVASQLSASI